VTAADFKPDDFETLLLRRGVFYLDPHGVGDFAPFYLGAKPNVTKEFVVDDAVMAQFHKFLDKEDLKYSEQDIQQHLPWLKWEIKREVFTTLFGLDDGYKVELQNDPQLDKGISSLPQAKALYATARRIVAQKQTGQDTKP